MRSRLRYAAITLLITSVPVAVTVLAWSTDSTGENRKPFWEVFAYSAAEWYPWAIVAPLIDRRARRSHVRSHADRVRVIAGHVALAIAFTVFRRVVMNAVDAAIVPGFQADFWRGLRRDLMPGALVYTAIATGFTVFEARRRQTEIAVRLRAEVAEARLEALRQQLNPHFLFNTLNHIVSELRSLRTEAVEPALKMLLALSDLLRDVLRERAQLIPLRDEIRMVERYLEIERARFGDRLQAEVTFEPRALDARVPSLLLQPLLENAMRHGVSAADGRCRVSLTARTRDDRLLIEVRDAGPGMDPARTEPTPGVGLRNTSERLKYLYGAGHSLEFKTLEAGGLLVTIDLPYTRA
jgi:signal transduction histidine kinase